MLAGQSDGFYRRSAIDCDDIPWWFVAGLGWSRNAGVGLGAERRPESTGSTPEQEEAVVSALGKDLTLDDL